MRFSLCYENGRKLQLVINRNHGEELISQVDNIKEQSIYLKVVVDKLTRSFYYSYDGNNGNQQECLKIAYICAMRVCLMTESVIQERLLEYMPIMVAAEAGYRQILIILNMRTRFYEF